MQNFLLLCLGSVFFPAAHTLIRNFLRNLPGQSFNEASVYVIACRCVSALQALIASAVGAIIASSCVDIMKDVHWLTNAYVFFGVPYFVYDLWAMYAYNVYRDEDIYKGLTTYHRVVVFVGRNIVMVAHHILLPSILLPIILVLRQNRGDFFFGVFYMFELVIPLISAREILVQLNLKKTKLYFYCSIAMIVVFFLCRLAMFPYLYYAYSHYAGISFIQVPYSIPIKCNLSCLLLVAPQIYWFGLMVRGLYRFMNKPESVKALD